MKNFNRHISHGHHGSKRRKLAQHSYSRGLHTFTPTPQHSYNHRMRVCAFRNVCGTQTIEEEKNSSQHEPGSWCQNILEPLVSQSDFLRAAPSGEMRDKDALLFFNVKENMDSDCG